MLLSWKERNGADVTSSLLLTINLDYLFFEIITPNSPLFHFKIMTTSNPPKIGQVLNQCLSVPLGWLLYTTPNKLTVLYDVYISIFSNPPTIIQGLTQWSLVPLWANYYLQHQQKWQSYVVFIYQYEWTWGPALKPINLLITTGDI